MLQEANLPAFGWGNWQSRIKSYVQILPEFATLLPFTSSEPGDCDFAYEDTQGRMPAWLDGQRVLARPQRERLRGSRAKYWIEVKATVGECATPFEFSRKQVQRVRSPFPRHSRAALTLTDIQCALGSARAREGGVPLRARLELAGPREAPHLCRSASSLDDSGTDAASARDLSPAAGQGVVTGSTLLAQQAESALSAWQARP